jgi:nucleotide-binding universal stress UspA family protein
LVVGHHGAGGFTGTMVGSVCAALGERADCPVVVVRSDGSRVPPHTGPIVLGLTRTPGDGGAIRFGFASAQRGETPLIAVFSCWTDLDEDPLAELSGPDSGQRLARARQEVSTMLAPARREHPGVAVTTRGIQDRPAAALLDAIERDRPQLLVIASNDRDKAHMLGPVARTLLHNATCPVAIVAPAQQTETVVTAPGVSGRAQP